MGAFAAVVMTVSMLVPGLGASPAQAANITDGFNPGNIVSDANFYDGRAMGVNEIQTFLNQRVPRCTIGDPGRTAGMKWGETKIASKCLRNFSMNSQSRASNAYCAAYRGRSGESAAQIIAKVGQACGISQRVLLIMLEKEQSLVTDTWPTVRQFDVAMGYACPDSGPGNSANCDPTQTGFFQQVYRAAWQLEVYRANPNSYNYKPFQNNRIQWHPNAGCGASTVYISNWATAALYIYTPYRPNQAALNAGWGTGDACSSYGNRNFYNFYKSWFGNPHLAFPVDGAILNYWQSNRAWLGNPKAAAVSNGANGGGRTQQFSGGIVFEPKAGQVSGMQRTSPIYVAYSRAGGIAGSWGWPVAPATNQGSSGNNSMRFQGGIAAEAKGYGVYLVPAKIQTLWEKEGGFAGKLGFPVAEALVKPGDIVSQTFKSGELVYSPSGGALKVDPEFLPAWRALGPGGGSVGVPIGTPTTSAANGGGKTYAMLRGTMYKSPAGVYAIGTGPFGDAYRASGGHTGAFGWPASPAECGLLDGGCAMSFQRGVGLWSGATGIVKLSPEAYESWGKHASELGYPKTTAKAVGTGSNAGTVHRFASGDIYQSKLGTFALPDGTLRNAYQSAGGPTGKWGWPSSDMSCDADGSKCVMSFVNGIAIAKGDGTLTFSRNLQDFPKERLSGADRYSTAAQIAKSGYPNAASTVIIASGADYPDALSAGALGAKWKAPLLLTSQLGVPEVTRSEIVRLKPERIVVAGGPGAVSDNALAQLKKLAPRVDRIYGSDRYQTSLAISQAGWPTGASAEVFLATGTDFADALSAGAAAGSRGAPVLLVPGNANEMPGAVKSELSRLGVKQVTIAGGVGAVSAGAEASIASGRTVQRFAGRDRFDTSALIAKAFFQENGSNPYWANGLDFADALAGNAIAGSLGAPLLLSRASCVPVSVYEATAWVARDKIMILGGTGVLTDEVTRARNCAL
ncbi:cell wall-binding repeat-containing protein [Leucobacter chromiiresistens]|uniref:cell wall-binding repeat-containing protein n=1 Tax=Leucobacter chromiiresistens TaxID=1079994 RepID=UPI0009DB64D9|nr:cell wall-binding repeat-containing protein [Leucobacter chromiiresistens]